MQPSVDYLGHQVDAEGLHTTADKVESFLKAPVPTNMQELCSFLGLLNYYGKFLPIAFASRTLTASEQNYSQLKKEALVLFFGVKKFHPYLFGRHFTLITNHKPLLSILSSKKGIPSLAAARLQHWAILMSAYGMRWSSSPRITMVMPMDCDGFLYQWKLVRSILQNQVLIFNISQIEALPVTASAVRKATRKDLILSKVFQYTRLGWPSLHSLSMVLKPFSTWQHELSIEDGCLMWGI